MLLAVYDSTFNGLDAPDAVGRVDRKIADFARRHGIRVILVDSDGLIEELTGLVFDDRIYDANPLIHSVADEAAEDAPITPERIEVGAPHEIFNPGDHRQTIKDDIVDVFIAAAMIDPEGADRDKEWISLINFSKQVQDISAWQLEDNSTKRLRIGDVLPPEKTMLKPGESTVVGPLRPLELANGGDVIRLYDDNNARIDWVNYTELMVRPGEPVLFLSPRDTLE